MTNQNFYRIFKDEGVSFGRKIAKKHVGLFLQIFLLLLVAEMIPAIVNWINHAPYEASNIGDIIASIVSIIFGFGLIKIFLHFVHDKKVDLKSLWDHDWTRFLWWIAARIVHGIMVFVGILLLIVPGIYIAARLYLYEYYVVDQKLNAKEALQASWHATKGHVWQIIGIGFLSFGIILLGALALGVGLLWAVPTVKLAQATLYKKVSSHDKHLE